jgi:sec-independent protein translocase protein TatB
MFDIGFSEIVVIAVVALVVIGPEKLPKTARTLGVLFGRLQRYVSDVKADINREMELDELRNLQKEMKSAATDIKESMQAAAQSAEAGVRDVEAQLNNAGNESAAVASAAPVEAAGSDAAGAEAARQRALPGFEKI